jgi:tetratricopeptide (TPR) repeat protein
MLASPIDPAAEIAAAVEEYRDSNNFSVLLDRLLAISAAADLDALIAAVEPYHDIPEVAGPVYERVVVERPEDARALVILANAYWLTGRGSEAVGELASRAIAADPNNRGAWHLWALSEPSPRERMARWQQVTKRFPADELAKANLADNAASIASTERDREALQIALRSYRSLLRTATRPEQRQALEEAIRVMEMWEF